MSPTADSNNEKPSILKRTRESKGLALEIVHEATKIPMDALRAIEEGYSVRILSPFYYRGFIKIYAEFLGLDVQEMYKQYGLDLTPKTTTSATVQVKSSRKAPVAVLPDINFEGFQERLAGVLKPKNIKLTGKIVVSIFLVFLLFKTTGCVITHFSKKGVPAKKQSTSKYYKQPKLTEETNDSKPLPTPPVVKHEAMSVKSENNKVEIAVRANKNTWLQVKTDDKVVFQMTLTKGSMESWSADNHIELQGRNLEQLDMEVNGKHIGSLGGGERRIRKVLINQEGLTVKK